MATAALSTAVPDRRHLALRLAGAAGVLVLLGVALTSLPGLREVRSRLAEASPVWLGAALALELGSCLAFVVAYGGVLRHGLPLRQSDDPRLGRAGAQVPLPPRGAGGAGPGAGGPPGAGGAGRAPAP